MFRCHLCCNEIGMNTVCVVELEDDNIANAYHIHCFGNHKDPNTTNYIRRYDSRLYAERYQLAVLRSGYQLID